jgi:amidase
MQLLMGFLGANFPDAVYRDVAARVAAIPAGVDTLDAVRGRGVVASHRDWVRADRARSRERRDWQRLFAAWDVVLAPPFSTPAFPHDGSPDLDARRLDIDGASRPIGDQLVWASMATLPGLPATTVPLERTREGLPVGVQVIGPFLEDRTTIAFARLIEREFGGFVPPP